MFMPLFGKGKGPQKSITGEEFRTAMTENWLRTLPKPLNLRYDPEGFFRGQHLIQWIEGLGIRIQAIAGEAPWQNGKHSRHLETVKENLSLLSTELGPTVELEQILDLTISAKNECHAVRGYSPNQWAFGQNMQRLESFFQSDDQLTIQSSRMHDLEFEELLQRRKKAKMIFMKKDARRRVQRASLYRSRRDQEFSIGQLVYFFRRGRGHGKRYESRWFGPGKVVCVEKQGIASEDGLTDGIVSFGLLMELLYTVVPLNS